MVMYSKKKLTVQEITKLSFPVFKKNGVIKAGLFGSAARGEMKSTSDIDFLITMKKGTSLLEMSHLRNQLIKNLQRDVNLVEYSKIRPRIKSQILQEEVQII